MDIPILRGRSFLESDGENAPLVAVVNEHLANHFWPKGDALGQRFHVKSPAGDLLEIVGVARMAKYRWINEPPGDFVYLPLRQRSHSAFTLVTQSAARDSGSISAAVRDVVHGIDPDMPVFDVRTIEDFYRMRAVKVPIMLTQVVGALGLMGLLLAVVGLYGLVAYSVSRRTREIGIRIAIGADPWKVVRIVLEQGLQLGAAGVAVGLVVAFFCCRAVTSVVMVGPSSIGFNPLELAAIALPLLLITMLATLAPARHASRVDPIRALREE
jgi:hypothetical protein